MSTPTLSAPDAFPIPDPLVRKLLQAKELVVFTGAGVSAESGISTFRDGNAGLWARFDAQALATPEAFRANPSLVWGWYEWRRAGVMRARPNPAHLAIAEMQGLYPGFSVVTQNVDDLHERAGSRHVTHLHGRLEQACCFTCGHAFHHPAGVPDLPEDGSEVEPPPCERCQGHIRPGVVWFGEALPRQEWEEAMEQAENCDVLFSVGTSSLVYPAAELPQRAAARGALVIQVNPMPTALDRIAAFNLTGPAGVVLPALLKALRAASA